MAPRLKKYQHALTHYSKFVRHSLNVVFEEFVVSNLTTLPLIETLFLPQDGNTMCMLYLMSNSENCEHLKNFRNVDCVLANHHKVQHTRTNLKTTN